MSWDRRNSLLVYAVFLFTIGPAAAAADWPVPRGPSTEPVPFRYDPRQPGQLPQQFLDDAPAVILYAGVNYLIEPDGTVETITHEVIRLNSRKAIQDLGEYRSIYHDPACEKLVLNEARVIKPEGRVVAVEPEHVQLRDSGTDFQVYDHSKQLVVSFPSLGVGDVIEVRWTTRGKDPEHHGHFFTRYTFGSDDYPVVCDEMRVRLPRDRALKFAVTGGKLDEKITDEQGYRLYHWKAVNRPQLPRDQHLPSAEEFRLQVSCSTFSSWEEVWRWKQQLRRDCWTCTAELRQVVEEVTRGLKTPEEKARALTYWVRQNIRYVSMGVHHAYTPHTPAAVYRNRFGDCKDTTQLLAVLLGQAGVSVALATLGVQGDGQVLEEVPSPWGTHALLLASIDGKDHWIDTTASLAGWDQLPAGDCGRLCYVTDQQGIRLLRTPPLTADNNRIEQTTTIRIGTSGSARCERVAVYHGIAALDRRGDWDGVPAGERRRQMTAELQDANGKSRLCLLDIDETRLVNHDQPVHARVVFDVLDMFADPDRSGSLTDSPVWSHLLYSTLSYDRSMPLELDMPFESIHRYVIELPPWFALDGLPADRVVRSKWGWFRRSVRIGNRRIEIEMHTRIDRVRVEPADFGGFRKFHEEVGRWYRVWLTLRPVQTPAVAELLEILHFLSPADPAAAALLAETYLHIGDRAAASRVLTRARQFHPDSIALAELALRSAGSLRAEEAIYRDLIRRNPDEIRFQLALGENLVDQERIADARAVLRPVAAGGSPAQKAEAWLQLAKCSLRDGKPALALQQIEDAGRADADSVRTAAAFRIKARIYELMKRPADAAAAYRDILDLDPDDIPALESLTAIELAAGNRDTALRHLRRFGAAVGDDALALARAADFHLKLGRFEDAFELASRSRDLVNNPLAQRTIGLVHLHRGDHQKAAFHLERTDVDSTVLEGLLRSRLLLGELHRAVQDADLAGKLDQPSAEVVRLCQTTLKLVHRRRTILEKANPPPDQVDSWTDAAGRIACAEHAWKSGRPIAEVEALLAPAMNNGIELGPGYGLRAVLHLETGRLTRSLADAERCLRLSPNEPAGWYVRGRVRLERAQNGALADLQKAAELSRRQDGKVLHWLAAALWQQGQRRQAVEVQQEAAKLRPTDRDVAEQLEEWERNNP